MPLLFIGTGVIFILTGLNGNPSALYAAVKNDFTGQNNFIYWMLSILTLGALGYIPDLKNLSRLFIVLVVIVLLLDNGGFFTQLQAFVKSTSSPSTSGTGAASTGSTGSSSTGSPATSTGSTQNG
jgi:hypothetical protein